MRRHRWMSRRHHLTRALNVVVGGLMLPARPDGDHGDRVMCKAAELFLETFSGARPQVCASSSTPYARATWSICWSRPIMAPLRCFVALSTPVGPLRSFYRMDWTIRWPGNIAPLFESGQITSGRIDVSGLLPGHLGRARCPGQKRKENPTGRNQRGMLCPSDVPHLLGKVDIESISLAARPVILAGE